MTSQIEVLEYLKVRKDKWISGAYLSKVFGKSTYAKLAILDNYNMIKKSVFVDRDGLTKNIFRYR